MSFPDRYDVTCCRDGASWSVQVPTIGTSGWARRLADVEPAAVDLVVAATRRARESVRIALTIDVADDLRQLVDAAAAARGEADRVSPAAVTRRRALARRLVAEDFAIADVAWLLGVSIARAHQLAGRGRGRLTAGRGRGTRSGRETRRPASRPDLRRTSAAGSGTSSAGGIATAVRDVVDRSEPPHNGYQHEAFFYQGDQEFLAGTVPFVREGVRQGQPVMVAVIESRLNLLRDALGNDGDDVHFVDMGRMGANPAKIIPAWQGFIDEHADAGTPIRGIGEPIWQGRRPEELVECQLHEALLNVAVDPDMPFWLSCPYDTTALGPDVLAEAHRSHPTLVGVAAGYRGSTTYGGLHHVDEIFRGDLPQPAVLPDRLGFRSDGLGAVRELVSRRGAEAGLSPSRVRGLVVAVTEFAAHGVLHGGGEGVLRLWREPGALICEVADRGYIDDPLVGRRDPDDGDDADRAVWLANEVCDLAQVRSTSEGTTFRVFAWL
jgi:hypothetical protein